MCQKCVIFCQIRISHYPYLKIVGDSPVTYFNLEEGHHTVRVKTEKCGPEDKRLNIKFTV